MAKLGTGIILFLLLLSLAPVAGDTLDAASGVASVAASPTPQAPTTVAEPAASRPASASRPGPMLRSASGATIPFKTQNGETVGGVAPQTREVPHLVLHRNGALTDAGERTLLVELAGIDIPPGGATVALRVETQHGDPDVPADPAPRIPVWTESIWMANDTQGIQAGATARFQHAFDGTLRPGPNTAPTPTGYFRYDLVIAAARQVDPSPIRTISQDYAFLLEDQWQVPLPQVQETAPGAAPDELVVYASDLVPFRRDPNDPATWLPRERVPGYVRDELIPAMVEAYRLQTDEWGFPWYPEWTSYRAGADTERLTVALADGQTWFHGKAPGQGNAWMSINASRSRVEYDTLTDGLMSTFHHELFHMQQRNIHLHFGGSGRPGGAGGAWDFFSEGTAVLASSVAQPGVQFSKSWGSRAFLANAGAYIGRAGISAGDLNKSYERLNPYHSAAYWRFLYEQCGGMSGDVENPAAGMAVIRSVLETLYAGDPVDVDASTGLVKSMPGIMDRALRRASCPFQTHRGSLVAFAQAIYVLRAEGGRCLAPGTPAGCGLYDPAELYHKPVAGSITYRGEVVDDASTSQPSPAGIPSSFGFDLVEVDLEAPDASGSLTIEVSGEPGAAAAFNVQLIALARGTGPAELPLSIAARPEASAGRVIHRLPQINAAGIGRLALIITRVDAQEHLDRQGAYTLVLRPDA